MLPTSTSAVMPTYARQELVFERGEGCWLISAAGERYLDFAGGVAVSARRHRHPGVIAGHRPGPQSVAYVQSLSRRRTGDSGSQAVRGGALGETRVLLQLWSGSLRRRHQVDAALSSRLGPAGQEADYHVQGRIPWPH